jgi:mannosyltransferase
MGPSAKLMEPNEVKNGAGDYLPKASLISAWLWAIIVLGAVLRLILLGRKSFWLDEIASVVVARLAGPSFWSMLWHAEGNMALYYVLLRPWLHFGVGEAAVRVLSALIGIASIPVMYALSASLFGETTARVATLFFALNACAIAVSQEARGYSLLVLGVIASTYLFVRLIEKPSFAIACAYGLVTGLTLYCHYFGMFVPAAQAISLVALPPGKRPWKQLALAACLVALAAIPVLWMIHIQDIGHITWVEKPSWLEFYRVGAYLAAGSGKAVGAVLLVLDLMLLGLFLRSLKVLWRSREPDLSCWRYLLIASCLLVPVVITLMISTVRPIFYHRFLIIGLPAWVLMTAVGAEQIRDRTWHGAAIACVCILSFANAIVSYTRAQEDWRGVAGYLIAQAESQDRVLYYQPEGYFAVENYRNWLPDGERQRPQGVSLSPANPDWEKQIGGAPRVWLVLYRVKGGDPSSRAINARLRNRYQMEQQVPFTAVTVVEYSAAR